MVSPTKQRSSAPQRRTTSTAQTRQRRVSFSSLDGDVAIESVEELARKGGSSVRRLKRLTFGALIVAAMSLASLVYWISLRDEKESFERNVRSFQRNIVQAAHLHAHDLGHIVHTMSSTVTANAYAAAAAQHNGPTSQSNAWPYVYDASFAALARQAQAQARDRHGRHRRGDDGYNNDDDRHQQNSIQHGILLAPIVTHQQRMQWEKFASLEASATATVNASTIAATTAQNDEPLMVRIHSIDTTNTTNPAEHLDYHLPVWQVEPLPNRSSSSTLIGLDLVSHAKIQRVVDQVLVTQRAALAPLLDFDELDQYLPNDDSSNSPTVQSFEQGTRDDVATEVRDQTHSNQQPRALLLQPVFSKLVLEDAAILATTSSNNNSNRTIVAMVVAIFSWQRLWHSVAEAADGMVVVLHSSCGSPDYTYQIHHTGSSDDTSSSLSKDDGTAAWMLGEGDLHEPTFDYLRHHVDFEPFRDMNAIGLTGGTHSGNETDLDESICKYTFDIYPTAELQAKYATQEPFLYALAVLLIFAATSLMFVVYDRKVHQRQASIMHKATQAHALISNIFPVPESMQKRIFQESMHRARRRKRKSARITGEEDTHAPEFQNDNTGTSGADAAKPHGNGVTAYTTKPIADLFTEATVLFADIGGFDAWSSVREPSQVFTLLETVYGTFDKVAKALKVFKVETIGDCYVAVTGLPVARSDHAAVMALFATEISRRFANMSKFLEIVLGPGTARLALRVGIHSGPVIAGVLRSDKARFQLFGDTMNVASRMESTGEKGRIQVSEETATLLKNAGIHLTPREEKVAAKGKGLLQTYWLDAPSCSGDETERDGASVVEEVSESEQAMNRLVDWNTCNLVQLLRVVQARRIALNSTQAEQDANDPAISEHQRAVEEVDEVIELPSFMAAAAEYRVDLLALRMKPEIIDEARNYIWTIAMWYQRNHFHNFEHASHVVMSVLKLLSRISAVKSGDTTSVEAGRHHEDTYGIASDPLTCFACVFAALIHDVDHCGIPNVELVKENAPLAKLYKSQSVAEQNSIDVAWKLLLEDRFSNFREAIFTNNDERRRFRKLLVASVIATDVMDKELKDLRNKRWDMAFGATRETEECASSQSNSSSSKSDDDERINRKATVVIEHLIQASDVCHTMQHWHVYREWNEKLYMEMYQAYMDGRTNSDPTDRWFDGELWFFDHYIIPLAKKLAHCDVFGVCSFEYLNFAVHNREEWEIKGREIVKEMHERAARKMHPSVVSGIV